jgi:formylglycine-generating enzyme required for sulfatase activity/serine/threonine protein kinase
MSIDDPLSLIGKTVLDKYAIDKVVGRGGFAVVYRATHLIWKRPVAIKVFTALGEVPEERRAELLADFNREGALLAELSERSAAICQARDVGMLPTADGELPFMVLEWLEGVTLEEVLEKERATGAAPRPMASAVRLLEPVAHALALAHDRGIAHRDVKPANIFVIGDPNGNDFDGTSPASPERGRDQTVKLLDFGIAKVVQDAQKMAAAFAKTSGIPTSFTPAYGAPEQFSRTYGATGPWTDVFALALVIAETVTGKEPMAGTDLAAVARRSIDETERPTPRALGAIVDDAVEEVFRRALAVRPENRYQRVGDFWSALRAASSMDSTDALAIGARSGRISVAQPANGDHDLARAATALAPADVLGASQPVPPSPLDDKRRQNRIVAVVAGSLFVTITLLGVLRYRSLRDGGSAPAPSGSGSVSAAVVDGAPQASAAPAAQTCPAGMILVPGGMAFIGDDSGPAEEKPQHQVELSAYCFDRFEVTLDEYRRCSNDGACKRASKTNDFEGITAKDRKVYDPLCNANEPDKLGKHPVNCVAHTDAEFYCHWRKGRLPTEAEWEFAARGSDGRRYPWGDDDPVGGKGHLNACGPECVAWGAANGIKLEAMYKEADEYPHTAPVGSFPGGRTKLGIEDLVGNVWEWVADYWGPYEATKVGAPQRDPQGPSDGKARVIRGGAWNSQKIEWAHPSYRYSAAPAQKSYGIGFRCAASPLK